MQDIPKTKKIRIHGKLQELIVLKDIDGNIIQKFLQPLMVEMYPRDIMQVIIGSTLLAIPVSFTQEVWDLGAELALTKILLLGLVSMIFISSFIYYNFYKNHLTGHVFDFIKRILLTYIFSFLIATCVLLLIDKAPWGIDNILALKRTILVAFPASMSAAVADGLK